METNMTRRKMTIVALLGSAFVGVVALAGLAEHYGVIDDDDDDEGPGLIRSIGDAKVSLQQGLTAGEQMGQPISGKFEVDDGKFQLSVYTTRDGKLSEVLVDYVTGKVSKTEPITQGDDLAVAKAQSVAMAKAKTSLKDAVDKATGDAAGYRAVGVVPGLKDGHPVASVLLLKGDEFKTVDEALE
jgi:hypothetical protein